MRAFILLLALSLPALADRIFLTEDRILEGTAVLDGDTYVIRTKLGVVKVPKGEVLRIEKTDAPAPAPEPAKKEEGKGFASRAGGFSFRVKGAGWTLLDAPVRPLATATAVNDALQAEVNVVPLEDKDPASPLTEDAAKTLDPTVRSMFGVSTLGAVEFDMKPLTLSSGAAFQYRTHARRKLTHIDLACRAVALKGAGKVWLLFYEAPIGAPVEAEAAFEDVLASFQTHNPKDADEGAYANKALEFSFRTPDSWGWQIVSGDDPAAKSITLSLKNADGSEEGRLDAKELPVEEDIERSMSGLSDALAKELQGYARGEEKMQTVHNFTARVLSFTFREGDKDRGGAAMATREGRRTFLLQVRAADAPRAGRTLETLAAGLALFSAKAAVQTPKDDLLALSYLHDGDALFASSNYADAERVYADAVKSRPRFAYAQLMLAYSALCACDNEASVTAAEAAWKMSPSREEFPDTLAQARAARGDELARDKQFDKAGDLLAGAGSLGKLSKEAATALHKGCEDLVYSSTATTRMDALKGMKKVHARTPEDETVTKDLARLYSMAATDLLSAGKLDEAAALVNEGLAARPNDPTLKDTLKEIEAKRKLKKK